VTSPLCVTGLGLVTPLGVGVEATWERLVRGERALGPVTLFDASGQRASLAAEVPDVFVPPGGWSRSSVMAATAAREAMGAASVDVRRQRVGLVVGGTTGGMFETERLLARLHAEPDCREVLVEMLSHPLTAAADRLDESLGPFARVRTLSSACSSGASAVVVAATWLLEGGVDVVVAGASDGLCRLTLAGFNALAALDPEGCRPFDRRRRGTALGEGAGFLVLERAESARARGVSPVAWLAGWALGCEAHHITMPAPDGALVARLIERAVSRAGRTARDIDYVHAHGTGTTHNDAMEAEALRHALGDEVGRIPVSSSKGQLGHTLGAAGAIEAVITALVVSRRTLVPTAGLDEPDGALGLVHVPHVGRSVSRVRAAVSNAFGFGGMDAVLVLTDGEDGPTTAAARAAPQQVVVTGATVFGPRGLLGPDACAHVTDGPPLAPGASAVDPDPHLDLTRARRLDRASRLGAVAVQHALAGAGLQDDGAALVLGSAFGSVDASAAYVHRILSRGARAASPADFPNLVPSSQVGHASIYLGVHGPAFATADLGTSGESAFAQAVQLVEAGEASAAVAGAVELRSDIVGRVLAALFGAEPATGSGPERVDLAAVVVLESERSARARGARVLARVRQTLEWRGDPGPLSGLVAPGGDESEVLVARGGGAVDALVAATAWGRCRRVTCAPALGDSDGLGAAALAVGASRVGSGLAAEVLVLGVAPGRGHAIVLTRP
jgi:3-oxoacyl-[acyl-carrier-protein] synthase II